jgi:hypothetical protein
MLPGWFWLPVWPCCQIRSTCNVEEGWLPIHSKTFWQMVQIYLHQPIELAWQQEFWQLLECMLYENY